MIVTQKKGLFFKETFHELKMEETSASLVVRSFIAYRTRLQSTAMNHSIQKSVRELKLWSRMCSSLEKNIYSRV